MDKMNKKLQEDTGACGAVTTDVTSLFQLSVTLPKEIVAELRLDSWW